MLATMMHSPMTVALLMRHGRRIHGHSTIASYDGTTIKRATFAEVAERAERLACALKRIGVEPGDRVATFCWNHHYHMEAYLTVPSMGAVLHTLNIRLFPEQLSFIVNHAEDKVLIVDAILLPLLADVLPLAKTIKAIIVVGEGTVDHDRVYDYETLLAAEKGPFDWPEIDETAAAVACYTSGTTGDPKGVVYSHKTIFVHSLASLGVDTFAVCQSDRILLLPPMFHANAWGLPYSAWLAGAALIMPGPHLQAAPIRKLVQSECPTFTAMVPTLINDLLQSHATDPIDMSSFRVLLCGGSAVAPALIDSVRKTWGVPILQGWGMTETSPMCCLSVPPLGTAPEEEAKWRSKSGRPVPGMEVRLVDEDGQSVANDGVTVGELELHGPWVTGGYYKGVSQSSFTADGWLKTGDVGTIDPKGYVQVTDRAKDVIKSGGEWISSVDLENRLCEHEGVREIAVISVADPKWEERPLAIVVPVNAAELEVAALRAYLNGRVARFWVPEYWAFVAELPKTSVGKIDKKALRALVVDGKLDVVTIKE